jgi:hypothetical protein
MAARKALLLTRIAARRDACVTAAAELAQPLGWLDQIVARWRGISPLFKMVGVPVGLFFGRKLFRGLGRGRWVVVGMLLRLILRAVRAAGKTGP